MNFTTNKLALSNLTINDRVYTFIRFTIVCIAVLGLQQFTQAAIRQSVTNGNWNSSSTWSGGAVPQAGDVVIISSEHTVTIDQNISLTGLPLTVTVLGIWNFNGGGAKISLPCLSVVTIATGGLLQTSGNGSGSSQTVKICSIVYWRKSDGNQSGPTVWPTPPLPVELLYFEANNAPDGVHLDWATATETNSDRFEIFISRNGERELIRTVAAQGFSTNTIRYEFIDEGRQSGVWYYDLVQFDRDGTRYEKGTIAVHITDESNSMTCILDPHDPGKVLVSTGGKGLTGQVRVITMDGRVVESQLWSQEGVTNTAVDVTSFRAGLYTLWNSGSDGKGRSCAFVKN